MGNPKLFYIWGKNVEKILATSCIQFQTGVLGQDLLKWEYLTRTPGSMQWVPVTCPQHNHRRLRIDLGLQGPINKKRILEQSQVIF